MKEVFQAEMDQEVHKAQQESTESLALMDQLVHKAGLAELARLEMLDKMA